MKIWLNDKRVVKDSGYTHCIDCCFEYLFPDHSKSICLAKYFKIRHNSESCIRGYKYETDV